MDYEKAYKEALEKAKAFAAKYVGDGLLISSEGSVAKEFNEIFTELKESEDMIFKELIHNLIVSNDYTPSSKEIFSIYGKTKEDCLTWIEKQGEQKPIEQDTETQDLWVYIREWNDKFGRLPKDEDELAACIDYVMKRQKPAAWSEKDKKINNAIYQSIDFLCLKSFGFSEDEVCDWLESLKDKVQPQSKQEWSEEDNSFIEDITNVIMEDYCTLQSDKEKMIGWLKSIKPNHWKPSEKQLSVLQTAIKDYGICAEKNVLESLYNNLKKL